MANTRLTLHGENSFTYQFFSRLVASELGVSPLLESLQQATQSSRSGFAVPAGAQVEVILFPSFGRRHGFGEPDALVLVDDTHAFSFEVERAFDMTGAFPQQPIRQLYRFHMLMQSLARGPRVNGRKEIAGWTITDTDKLREANLPIAGRKWVTDVSRRMKAIVVGKQDHYVLLTQHEQQGVGHGRLSVEAEKHLEKWDRLASGVPGQPPFPRDRLWYAYWPHLKGKVGFDLDDPSGHTVVLASQRRRR